MDVEDSAVEAYLDFLGDTNAGKFNVSGRAYPDVAAQGQRVEIVDGGRTGLVAGTCEFIFSRLLFKYDEFMLTECFVSYFLWLGYWYGKKIACASPIFASVVALINDDLLAAGKPVLGFLNPWIYAHPEAFNDITTGAVFPASF